MFREHGVIGVCISVVEQFRHLANNFEADSNILIPLHASMHLKYIYDSTVHQLFTLKLLSPQLLFHR